MPKHAGDMINFQKVRKCIVTLLPSDLQSQDLGPDHRPPHTAHADRPTVHHTAAETRNLPSDVLAAYQTPMPLPVSVVQHATPGFHVQKGH